PVRRPLHSGEQRIDDGIPFPWRFLYGRLLYACLLRCSLLCHGASLCRHSLTSVSGCQRQCRCYARFVNTGAVVTIRRARTNRERSGRGVWPIVAIVVLTLTATGLAQRSRF